MAKRRKKTKLQRELQHQLSLLKRRVKRLEAKGYEFKETPTVKSKGSKGIQKAKALRGQALKSKATKSSQIAVNRATIRAEIKRKKERETSPEYQRKQAERKLQQRIKYAEKQGAEFTEQQKAEMLSKGKSIDDINALRGEKLWDYSATEKPITSTQPKKKNLEQSPTSDFLEPISDIYEFGAEDVSEPSYETYEADYEENVYERIGNYFVDTNTGKVYSEKEYDLIGYWNADEELISVERDGYIDYIDPYTDKVVSRIYTDSYDKARDNNSGWQEGISFKPSEITDEIREYLFQIPDVVLYSHAKNSDIIEELGTNAISLESQVQNLLKLLDNEIEKHDEDFDEYCQYLADNWSIFEHEVEQIDNYKEPELIYGSLSIIAQYITGFTSSPREFSNFG